MGYDNYPIRALAGWRKFPLQKGCCWKPKFWPKVKNKQDCIDRYSLHWGAVPGMEGVAGPGVPGPGGCAWSRRGAWSGGVSQHALRQTPPVNRMTNRRNITLPQTLFAGSNHYVSNSISTYNDIEKFIEIFHETWHSWWIFLKGNPYCERNQFSKESYC